MNDLSYGSVYDINTSVLIFFLLLLLIIMGLAAEMLTHQNITLEKAARLLKRHIWAVLKTFLKRQPVRHKFDYQLGEELKKVVNPYRNTAFETTANIGIISNTPCIIVRFVPSNVLQKQEQDELAELVLLKFRQYLYFWDLPWECFSLFQEGVNYGEILIFYSELPEDKKHYKNRYRVFQRANEPKSNKTLVDDSLEEELIDES